MMSIVIVVDHSVGGMMEMEKQHPSSGGVSVIVLL